MTSFRLLVTDVAKALEFYVKLLEFELVEQWGPPFAIIRREGCTVWLSGPGTSAQRPLHDGSQPEPGGWNRVVVEVKELEPLLVKLRLDGYVLRNEPVEGPGGRQALVEDGVGNVVEIFQPS